MSDCGVVGHVDLTLHVNLLWGRLLTLDVDSQSEVLSRDIAYGDVISKCELTSFNLLLYLVQSLPHFVDFK